MVEKIEINLIPNEYRVHSKSIKIPQDILISVLFSLIAIGVAFGVSYWKKQHLAEVESEIVTLTKDINTLKAKETKIKELQLKQAQFKDMKKGLSSISVDQDTWIRLFEIYCREVPPNTWIKSIEGEEKIPTQTVYEEPKNKKRRSKKRTSTTEKVTGPPTNTITLKGQTEAFGEVGQFMARLQGYPNISTVKIVEVKTKNTKESSFEFEIVHGYVSSTYSTVEGRPDNKSKKRKKKGK